MKKSEILDFKEVCTDIKKQYDSDSPTILVEIGSEYDKAIALALTDISYPILIICPRPLVPYWHSTLSHCDMEYTVEVIDYKTFIELGVQYINSVYRVVLIDTIGTNPKYRIDRIDKSFCQKLNLCKVKWIVDSKVSDMKLIT